MPKKQLPEVIFCHRESGDGWSFSQRIYIDGSVRERSVGSVPADVPERVRNYDGRQGESDGPNSLSRS